MSETNKITYGTKCFKIFFVFYLSSVVQAEHRCKVIVIERIVPGDVNYLALKYHPVGVPLPDLDTELWVPLPEYRRYKWNTFPHVEIGPGAFKTQLMQRQRKKLAKSLNILLDLKKKKLEQGKDLNEGKEFLK